MGLLRKVRHAAAIMACIATVLLSVATTAQASDAHPGNSLRPLATVQVHPGNVCGGFNGDVEWSEDPYTQGGQIHIWGKLWNNKCPGINTWLFVAYTLSPSGTPEFFPISDAPYSGTGGNVDVNWTNSKPNENFTGISVVVCNSEAAGGCGSSWRV
jgi:hypothetical protein